jgi:hypothetical protein
VEPVGHSVLFIPPRRRHRDGRRQYSIQFDLLRCLLGLDVFGPSTPPPKSVKRSNGRGPISDLSDVAIVLFLLGLTHFVLRPMQSEMGKRSAWLGRVSLRFRLKQQTIATVMQDGKRIAVRIPEGAAVLVVDLVPEGQSGDRCQQVNVQWKGETYTMFLVDLQERGEPTLAAEGK